MQNSTDTDSLASGNILTSVEILSINIICDGLIIVEFVPYTVHMAIAVLQWLTCIHALFLMTIMMIFTIL